MSDTLVLNADGNPLSIIPLSTIKWQEAIKLVVQDKVVILETYDEIIHSQYTAIPMPSVVMTKQYYPNRYKPSFSKLNIYYRDNFTCQYCFSKFKFSDLTLDHVIPKSQKGKKTFTNIVTSCKRCNQNKADKKILPKNKPRVPTYYEMANNRKKYNLTVPDLTWQKYLNWDESLLRIGKSKDKYDLQIGD
jgi:5-methylcytosine-specific restriction endonuclease McrA